jgi:hypothetical protein
MASMVSGSFDAGCNGVLNTAFELVKREAECSSDDELTRLSQAVSSYTQYFSPKGSIGNNMSYLLQRR